MSTKIYVGNLPWQYSSEELSDLFSQHGAVISAKIISDRDTGRSRGFGFVEMENADEANQAIEAINDMDVGGRRLRVNEARPRENRDFRGGGGGGGGGRGGDRGGRGGPPRNRY